MCRTKRILILGTMSAALVLAGCKASSTSVNPPLAPGYTNQPDQVMGQTLEAAKAFYQTIQADIQAGKYSPSQAEKTSLQTFAATLNVALSEYLAFHQGLATQAQAQAAVNSVTSQQSQLQALVQTK